MKNIEKKWTLFLVASFVCLFGIIDTLSVKGTRSTFDTTTGELVSSYNILYSTNWPEWLSLEDETVEYRVQTTGIIIDNMYENPTGYKFDSWNTEPDGSGISYVEGESIFLSSDITLYAQWVETTADEEVEEESGVVNTSFSDINFYRCVVNAYNLENNTEHDYTSYNLSSDELATIINLSCSGEFEEENGKINSVKGLEKLVSLQSLNLNYNLLTEIDVTSNSELTNLYLGSDLITYGTDVARNQIYEIDLSKNTKLEVLNVAGNLLTEIDLSNNQDLTVLDVSGNRLTGIDLSSNLKLNDFIAFGNDFANVDLSKNTELLQIDLTNNNLDTIDLSKNIKLQKLFIGDNELKELDLSKNMLLELIDAGNNLLDIIYNDEEFSLSSSSLKLPETLDVSEITWVSENENIVLVDKEGNVSIKDNGSVEIHGSIEGTDLSILTTINIVGISSDRYIINDDSIYVGTDSITDIKSNISTSDEEIEIYIDENISMLQVKYGFELIKTFKLVDTDSINNIQVGTTVADIKNMVSDAIILNKNDVVIEDDDSKLKTGDKIVVHLTDETIVYTVSVSGDITGDGDITSEDLSQIAKHLIKGNVITGDEYISAADINDDGKISINDVIKLAKYIINGSGL